VPVRFRLGYEAVVVKDGNEVIQPYERAMESGDPFDAVILDLTVKGGMGGRDAVKSLLRMDPQGQGRCIQWLF
jgi:CheY-like chemotaxis protein